MESVKPARSQSVWPGRQLPRMSPPSVGLVLQATEAPMWDTFSSVCSLRWTSNTYTCCIVYWPELSERPARVYYTHSQRRSTHSTLNTLLYIRIFFKLWNYSLPRCFFLYFYAPFVFCPRAHGKPTAQTPWCSPFEESLSLSPPFFSPLSYARSNYHECGEFVRIINWADNTEFQGEKGVNFQLCYTLKRSAVGISAGKLRTLIVIRKLFFGRSKQLVVYIVYIAYKLSVWCNFIIVAGTKAITLTLSQNNHPRARVRLISSVNKCEQSTQHSPPQTNVFIRGDSSCSPSISRRSIVFFPFFLLLFPLVCGVQLKLNKF